MEPKISFKYKESTNEIIMVIIANNQVIFYEEVTDEITDVIKEYRQYNE